MTDEENINGRGMKTIFSPEGGGVNFEMVQTCGDDQPEFLPKRVE